MQNLFQMLTASAAVSMWVRLQFDTPEFLYPGHWVALGCGICAWGTFTRYPAWIAVRMMAVGLLFVMVGVVGSPPDVLCGMMFGESEIGPMQYYWKYLQKLAYLPPLVGVAMLPRAMSLSQCIRFKEEFWLLSSVTFGWMSIMGIWWGLRFLT